ncbi:unnamed protein product [Rodentolepis nana]|uniref:Phosphoacetylglucosamine mutase n=1 Tax=Rodentolepis nana TaxID=102285 RepID=A0A0R3T5M7_RODNA|nr:unnamed protein product [Rodentolepis nana]
MEDLLNKLHRLLDDHSLSPETRKLTYGTSGYRCRADLLVGGGKAVGIMITASHNPPQDNGLKLINTDGGMFPSDFENSIIEFVQLQGNQLESFLLTYFSKSTYNASIVPQVYIGWDSRDSSVSLSQEVTKAITALGGKYIDFGLVTTPQLHFLVHIQSKNHPPNSLEDYVNVFLRRFVKAFNTLKGGEIHLNVDCAHGVGALILTSLSTRLYLASKEASYSPNSPRLCLRTFNTMLNKKDLLNKDCGADFIKLYSKLPKLTPLPDEKDLFTSSTRWATVDGDADRLLYFFCSENSSSVNILDGDHIAALFTTFIADQLAEHQCLQRRGSERIGASRLRLGVVQTAYANAASTRFLKQYLADVLNDPNPDESVVCTLTGVKHLHKAAKEFDFGVYFEANGHGTVVLSERAQHYVASLPDNDPLPLFMSLVNTAVGDAVTDILLVEYILAVKGHSLQQWFDYYHDLPSKQLKVVVKDRHVIVNTDADRKVTHPLGLQEDIDSLVKEVDAVSTKAGQPAGLSRAFVRPSGTEDMVRVYAEAATVPLVDWLATSVARLVHEKAGGVGVEPTNPGPIPY